MTQKKFPRQSEKHSSAAPREVKAARGGPVENFLKNIWMYKRVDRKDVSNVNFVCSLGPPASKNMNGTRSGHAFSSVRHALGNQKLLAWQQPETVLANDDRVFPLYYKHVFVELMPVSRTLPIPKAFPETRLTSIGAIENISLDVSRVLRFGSNLVGWIPHELWKVIHLS